MRRMLQVFLLNLGGQCVPGNLLDDDKEPLFVIGMTNVEDSNAT